MQKGILGAIGILILGSAPLSAQSPGPPTLPKVTLDFTESSNAITSAPLVNLTPSYDSDAYRVWGRSEYLLWWVKNTPLPPLVTTGNSNDAFPGAIGQPSTRVLFGGSGDYGATSGGRLALGMWLDSDQTIGVEGSGFRLAAARSASTPLPTPPGIRPCTCRSIARTLPARAFTALPTRSSGSMAAWASTRRCACGAPRRTASSMLCDSTVCRSTCWRDSAMPIFRKG